MVTSPAGNGVIIIGGEKFGESCHSKLLELKNKPICASSADSRNTMEWVELSQKLISKCHYSSIAIAIPDDLSPSNKTILQTFWAAMHNNTSF